MKTNQMVVIELANHNARLVETVAIRMVQPAAAKVLNNLPFNGSERAYFSSVWELVCDVVSDLPDLYECSVTFIEKEYVPGESGWSNVVRGQLALVFNTPALNNRGEKDLLVVVMRVDSSPNWLSMSQPKAQRSSILSEQFSELVSQMRTASKSGDPTISLEQTINHTTAGVSAGKSIANKFVEKTSQTASASLIVLNSTLTKESSKIATVIVSEETGAGNEPNVLWVQAVLL